MVLLICNREQMTGDFSIFILELIYLRWLRWNNHQ